MIPKVEDLGTLHLHTLSFLYNGNAKLITCKNKLHRCTIYTNMRKLSVCWLKIYFLENLK